MRSHYVDFRSPIVSQDMFARSVATQSHEVYTRLIHSSVVARHLPRGLDTSRDMALYVRAYSVLYTMHELQRTLSAVEQLLPPSALDDDEAEEDGSTATQAARTSALLTPPSRSFCRAAAAFAPAPAHALPRVLRRCLSLADERDRPAVCGAYAASAAASAAVGASEGARACSDRDTHSEGDMRTSADALADVSGAHKEGCGRALAAPEMTLWLCLLAWTQQALLTLLRDLCAAQGSVAWSAWYWSWAQLHPLHACVHQALSSVAFWRRGAKEGLPAQLRYARHAAFDHLDALRRLFRAIVSCIGATYGILEQLNAKVAQLSQRCDAVAGPAASCHTSVFQADEVLRRSTRYLRHRGPPGARPDTAPREPHTTLSAPPGAACAELRDGDCTWPEGGVRRRAMTGTPPPPAIAAHDVVQALAAAVNDAIAQLGALLPPAWTAGEPCVASHTPRPAMARGAEEAALPAAGEGDEAALTTPPAREGPERKALRIQLPAVLLREAQRTNPASATSPRGCLRRLRRCVERCGDYTARLSAAALREHHPPHARHAGRVALAAALLVPSAVWLSSRTVEELWGSARRACALGRLLFRSYVAVPLRQMKESLFYVPPSTQAQRESFEHDARALADIISDYHQHHFPGQSAEARRRVHAHTLQCLRAGVTDDEGYGLVQAHYRTAVQQPLLHTLFGQLPRILLIQMSHQALEVSRVTNGIDEVLMSNDLNFKVMAVMPLFLLGGVGALWLLYRWRSSYQPVRRRMKRLWRAMYRLLSVRPTPLLLPPTLAPRATTAAASPAETAYASSYARSGTGTPCRSTGLRGRDDADDRASHAAGGEAERAVTADAAQDTLSASRLPPEGDEADDHGAATAARDDEETNSSYDQGVLLLLVHVMRTTVLTQLQHDDFVNEWLEDLNDLESVQSTLAQRLEILRRMRHMHPILN